MNLFAGICRFSSISLFMVLASCGGGGGGDTQSIQKTSTKIIYLNTKAKVFLGSGDDVFTISDSGTTVYGNNGNDVVTILAGAAGVTLDQNIEQITFPGSSSNYKFKQTGNMINVYDASNDTLLATTPVQDDSDGSLLAFNDGTASCTIAADGVMRLGNAPVSSSMPTILSILPSNAISTVNLSGSSTATTGLDVKLRYPQGVSFLSYSAIGPAAGPEVQAVNTNSNTLSLTLLKNSGILSGEILKFNFRINQGSPQGSAFQLYSSYATIGSGSQDGGSLSISTQIQLQ